MFNEELFFSLCEKYDVEISTTALAPMIKDESGCRPIIEENIENMFLTYQTYFEYSDSKVNLKKSSMSYTLGDYATAC